MQYQTADTLPTEFHFLIDYLNAQHKNDQEFLVKNSTKAIIMPEGCRPIINEFDEVYGFFATMTMDDGSRKVMEVIRIPDESGEMRYYSRILTAEEIEKAKRNTVKM